MVRAIGKAILLEFPFHVLVSSSSCLPSPSPPAHPFYFFTPPTFYFDGVFPSWAHAALLLDVWLAITAPLSQ
ncbi:hypothetical protein BDV41DRAFT_532853 [Aspergillus transmontanensis]|uniref:Uncharacterized protein n=1 Tax=Aspergillus transmontanensis TaxID=1034304 RepID=A0A5N6W2K1_9EURO|nr:hypothetical protein BDV41DRAFT_532853 [Aspergillus transmontanensis]